MSQKLLSLAQQFISGQMGASVFVDSYIDQWRLERDSNVLSRDVDQLSTRLASIFCVADLFNPETDKKKYEFDEQELRNKVSEILVGKYD